MLKDFPELVKTLPVRLDYISDLDRHSPMIRPSLSSSWSPHDGQVFLDPKVAYWAEIIGKYRRSGLTQGRFRQEQDVSYHGLRWWPTVPRQFVGPATITIHPTLKRSVTIP